MSGLKARSRRPEASQASLRTPVYKDRATQSSRAASSAKAGKVVDMAVARGAPVSGREGSTLGIVKA